MKLLRIKILSETVRNYISPNLKSRKIEDICNICADIWKGVNYPRFNLISAYKRETEIPADRKKKNSNLIRSFCASA